MSEPILRPDKLFFKEKTTKIQFFFLTVNPVPRAEGELQANKHLPDQEEDAIPVPLHSPHQLAKHQPRPAAGACYQGASRATLLFSQGSGTPAWGSLRVQNGLPFHFTRSATPSFCLHWITWNGDLVIYHRCSFQKPFWPCKKISHPMEESLQNVKTCPLSENLSVSPLFNYTKVKVTFSTTSIFF